MQHVYNLPSWVPLDFPTLISSLRWAILKGVDKAHHLRSHAVDSFKYWSRELEVNEWLSMEGLFCLTILIVIISSIFVISMNLYRKIRYAIPARVNCWFCNTNTKVLYSLKDTWTCPKCHQYNGFTPDGHYNKRIPAQFIEALNRPIRGSPAKGYQNREFGSNGLCSQCNLNQVLKVFQLASFVPVNEKNYDIEIEAEQKRLEQLYDICGECKTVVDKSLRRTPTCGKQGTQSTMYKNNSKINKVNPVPTLTSMSPVEATRKFANEEAELSLLHEDLMKDVSETSENSSGDSFLSLDNLKIGSKNKNKSFVGFHRPQASVPTRSHSQSPPQSSSPPLMMGPSSMYGSSMQLNHGNNMPLWRDYPLVQGGMSPTYSVIDSMSCPIGRPAYVAYNTASPHPYPPGQFSYQSSNIGGVFGGRKPLISPPKFSNNSTPSFAPYIRYGAYYDISNSPAQNGIGASPLMFSPHFFANPISRSSSQSSGFVSQHGGGGPLSPQSQQQPEAPIQPSGFCTE